MRVVQSFTREPQNQTSFRGISDRYREANYETVVLNGLYFPVVDLLSSLATAIVLGYGGWLLIDGEMTIGTLLAFTLYLSNFFDPVQQLSQLYNTFLSAIAALDKIIDVLDEEPEVVDAAGAAALTADRGHVRFERRPLRLRRWARGAARHRPRRRRPGRRSRSSATPAPASRRSRSSSPASTTRARAGSRSTATICAT